MRIDLNFPRPWEIKDAPGGRRTALLPGGASADRPDAVVSIGPLLIRPDDPKAWMAQCVASELPAGARVRRGKQLERKTQDGWPMQLSEAELLGPSDEVIECRICAFYFFMEHATFALVRTPDRTRMEQHGAAILQILHAGRPSWRTSEPLCLAEAWDLEPRRSPPRAHLQLKGVSSNRPTSALNDALGQLDGALAIGQALWSQKKFAAALDAFENALALEPNDLAILRKVIRCHYALGNIEDGVAMRRHFRAQVAAGVDPRARLLTEYVYDQFAGDGFFVQALETLQAADAAYVVLTFRAVDFRDQPLPAAFLVETGELARSAGTPYVFGVQSRAGLKILGTAKQLPAYPELKAKALELLSAALNRSG